jgi:hypothetical protein
MVMMVMMMVKAMKMGDHAIIIETGELTGAAWRSVSLQ